MKKQKVSLLKLSLKKTAITPLSDNAAEQVKGGIATRRACAPSIANPCIPATEYVSCRCV